MARQKGYNPVSNPNPDNDPGRLPVGIMSQGTTGNIAGNFLGMKHRIEADEVTYGDSEDHDMFCRCGTCS